jgi:Nucleotidyltransferase of unknown function (DUF6036)
MQTRELDQALAACGELLAAEGEEIAIVVVGGATLNLLGLVRRSTSDVDVIARADLHDGELTLVPAEPFPDALARATGRVARDFGLAPDWLNADVGKQWTQGLPPGIEHDLTWRRYGGLHVGLAGRRTLVALKLFAAADGGEKSVHLQDLVALAPTAEELSQAEVWVRTQDASPEFAAILQQVVERAGRAG